MNSKASFWKQFGSESVNDSQKVLKSAKKYIDASFLSFWAKLSYKKLFSIRSKILGLFENTLTANYEDFRNNRENLHLPIKTKLSEKS